MDVSFGDGVDVNTFNQILEMDDTDEREFSSALVFDFFTQAEDTFSSMDNALYVLNRLRMLQNWWVLTRYRQNKNLEELSSLGHFLKGSSATLGLIRVRDGCEKIQRFGKLENEDGSPEKDKSLQLGRITEALSTVKKDYEDVKATLQRFYENTDAA